MTYQLPLVIEEGARHNELFKYACSLQARGLEDNEITENLLKASNENCNPPYPKNETIGIIKSVTNQYPKGEKYTEKGKDNNKASYPIKNNSKEPTGANMEPKEVEEDYSDKEKYRWEKSGPYIYKDKKGSPIFSKTKWEVFERKNNKRVDKFFPYYDFINKHKDLNKLNKKEKSLIYCLDKVEKAKENNETIYLVEGEKDADNLQKMGLVATCFKSSTEKFNKYYKDQFNGIDTIYIIPDFDKTGIEALLQRVEELKSIVKNVYVFRWYPSTKIKFDITDLIEEKNLDEDKLIRVLEDSKEKEIPDYYYKLIDEKMRINSLQELYKRLEIVGNNWRKEHKEEDQKAPKIPPYIMANLIDENCFICLLVAGFDTKNAPISFYNPSEGIYEVNNNIINVMMNCLEKGISKNKQGEIHNQLRILLERKNQFRQVESDPNYSILGNGIYNHKYRMLEPFTPRKVFTSKIATNLNRDQDCPEFKDWSFEKWIGEEISEKQVGKLALVWQVIASVIQPNRNNKTAFFLYDEKSNTGKSTFSQLLINIVGPENVSTLDLKELEHPFYPSTAEGKALIVGDDNDRRMYLDKSNNFKRITSGEPMAIQRKGKDGYNTVFNTTIVQSMNGIPRFGTIDQGLLNRIVFIGFKHQYTKEKGNLNVNVKREYIKDKRLLEYIVSQAIDMPIDNIERTDESKKIVSTLADNSDTTIAFVNEMIDKFKSTRLPIQFLFTVYQEWCRNIENVNPKIGRKQFTTRVEEHMEAKGWERKKSMKFTKGFNLDEDIEILDNIISVNLKNGNKENTVGIYDYYKNIIDKNKPLSAFEKVREVEED